MSATALSVADAAVYHVSARGKRKRGGRPNMVSPLETLLDYSADALRPHGAFTAALAGAHVGPSECLALLRSDRYMRTFLLALLLYDANSSEPHPTLFMSDAGYECFMQLMSREMAAGSMRRAFELRMLTTGKELLARQLHTPAVAVHPPTPKAASPEGANSIFMRAAEHERLMQTVAREIADGTMQRAYELHKLTSGKELLPHQLRAPETVAHPPRVASPEDDALDFLNAPPEYLNQLIESFTQPK